MKLPSTRYICGLLVLVELFLLTPFFVPDVEAIGTISRSIIVNNNIGSAQTNYPVDITLNTTSEIAGGRMRSDCGDIRVFSNTFATNLSYAVLNCNSTFTTVVFVIPSLPAGNTTVHVTFGDPALTSTATPATVFDRHEMFTAAPTCTLSGATPPVWNNVNQYLVLTNAVSANTHGECNYTYPAPAATIKGYKSWFDVLVTTAAGSTPAGTANAGQAIWQYAYDSAIPKNEDITSSGGHFTLDSANTRKCYTRAITSGAACVTANGTSPNTGSVSDATLGDGIWRSISVSHDPTTPATGTKRMTQNGVNILSTTAGTAVTNTNTNFGFGGRKTTTRRREQRVRRFAVMRYSELVTAKFVESTDFVLRNTADTANYNNICDFGSVTVTAVASCSYRLKFTTNSGNGYSLQVLTSGGLASGATTIANATAGSGGSGGTLIVAGTETYGVVISPNSCTRGTNTLANAFNPTAGNSTLFNYPTPTTVVTCTGQNLPATTDLANTVLVTKNLAISGNTPAGDYTQTVTWTAAPNY